MGRLILRRLLATIPVLVLVTLGVFLLIHLVPGDPVEAMMGESQDPVAKEALRHELGFDQPLYVQYVSWMGHVVQGDLGRSVRTHQTVLDNVSHRIRPSLELAVLAMVGIHRQIRTRGRENPMRGGHARPVSPAKLLNRHESSWMIR